MDRAQRHVGLRRPADRRERRDRGLPAPPAGFGSVKVEVTLGESRWSTSVFPDAERKTFVLPVKAAVRRREGVDVGDTVRIAVETLI